MDIDLPPLPQLWGDDDQQRHLQHTRGNALPHQVADDETSPTSTAPPLPPPHGPSHRMAPRSYEDEPSPPAALQPPQLPGTTTSQLIVTPTTVEASGQTAETAAPMEQRDGGSGRGVVYRILSPSSVSAGSPTLHALPRSRRGSGSSSSRSDSNNSWRNGTFRPTTTTPAAVAWTYLKALSLTIPDVTGGRYTRQFEFMWPPQVLSARRAAAPTGASGSNDLGGTDTQSFSLDIGDVHGRDRRDVDREGDTYDVYDGTSISDAGGNRRRATFNNNSDDDDNEADDVEGDSGYGSQPDDDDDGYVYLVDAVHHRVMYHRPPPIHVPLSTVDDHVPYTVVSLPPYQNSTDGTGGNMRSHQGSSSTIPPAAAVAPSSEIVVAVQPVGYRYHFYNTVLQANNNTAVAVSSSTFQQMLRQEHMHLMTMVPNETTTRGAQPITTITSDRQEDDGSNSAFLAEDRNGATETVVVAPPVAPSPGRYLHYDDVVAETAGSGSASQQRQQEWWGFKTVGGDYVQRICLPWYDCTIDVECRGSGAGCSANAIMGDAPVVHGIEPMSRSGGADSAPVPLRRRASSLALPGSPLRSSSRSGGGAAGASTVEEDILMHWAWQRHSTASESFNASYNQHDDDDDDEVPPFAPAAATNTLAAGREATTVTAADDDVSLTTPRAPHRIDAKAASSCGGVHGVSSDRRARHHHVGLRRRSTTALSPPASKRSPSVASVDVWLYVFYTFLPRCDFGPVRLVCRTFNKLLTMRCAFWQLRLPPAFVAYDDEAIDSDDGVSAATAQRLANRCLAHRIIRAVDHGVLPSRHLLNAKCLKGCCHEAWRTAILNRRDAELDHGTMDEELAVCTRIVSSVMFPIAKFSRVGGDAADNPTMAAEMRQRQSRIALWMSMALVVAALILLLVFVVSLHSTAAAAAASNSGIVTTTDENNSSLSVSVFLPLWVFAVLSYAVLYRFCMCSTTETIVMALFQIVSVQLTVILIASYCIDTATATVTSCMTPSILAATSLITYGAITLRHRLMDEGFLATYLRSPLLIAILLLKALVLCGALLFCIFLAADLDDALTNLSASDGTAQSTPAPPPSGGGRTPAPFVFVPLAQTSSQQAKQRLRVTMATFLSTARTGIPFVLVPVACIALLVVASVRIGVGQMFEEVPTVMATVVGYVVSLTLVAVLAVKCMADGGSNALSAASLAQDDAERESTYGIVMCALTSFGLTSLLSVAASHVHYSSAGGGVGLVAHVLMSRDEL